MVDYPWKSGEAEHTHAILFPVIRDTLRQAAASGRTLRVLDVGSGNGALTAAIAGLGHDVMGIEPSAEGIAQARRHFPGVRFESGSGYDDLRDRFGTFDIVVSCEVIEHLLTPGVYLKRIREVLGPESLAIISTPYHGYIKNLAIAAFGKWDFHHHPAREWGHVKFFSRRTLNELAAEVGLQEAAFHRVGRVPVVAKSMISVFRPVPVQSLGGSHG
jgi:2-polyprenyl-6-hydroxyphenyl methylase/3-demethylubiquinone-9 3-methyltransferase